jgi:hypothetical protein
VPSAFKAKGDLMPNLNSWNPARFRITKPCGSVHDIFVSGRDRWALESLITAGSKGCTPIDNPGPRWSAYIFNLRELGVEIETIHEPHEGPFKGSHGRYVLRCMVTRADEGKAA